ncbi:MULTISPECIES: hypothetical protein [Sinomonas]|jgi:hypothetical protein|uniref:Uncharacterized protein n=1 Tax=Sinomonas flava TaxID=496857 RepID=A0ABN3BXN2_9MICC|nr:hypothetical protein [Sinomonas sp. R1AF57]ASN50916.1 hypothetical protein CGQ25_01485 [Sinomonas sp. R1AF57]
MAYAPSIARVARHSWHELRRGALVHITAHGEYIGPGTVDGASRDGSVLWIQFGGIEGRRMFHSSDDVVIAVGSRPSR